jgi:hypothetical protein
LIVVTAEPNPPTVSLTMAAMNAEEASQNSDNSTCFVQDRFPGSSFRSRHATETYREIAKAITFPRPASANTQSG